MLNVLNYSIKRIRYRTTLIASQKFVVLNSGYFTLSTQCQTLTSQKPRMAGFVMASQIFCKFYCLYKLREGGRADPERLCGCNLGKVDCLG